jgi:hypothetical protein
LVQKMFLYSRSKRKPGREANGDVLDHSSDVLEVIFELVELLLNLSNRILKIYFVADCMNTLFWSTTEKSQRYGYLF